MTSNTSQSHRYTRLTKLTLTALIILTLAYASEFFLLGQLDLEVGIVVAGIVATIQNYRRKVTREKSSL